MTTFLVSSHPCGCLSHLLVVDGSTAPYEVGNFHAKAFRRKCTVREVTSDEKLPSAECGKPDCVAPKRQREIR